MEASTKERLIEAGMAMLLEHGYNHLGIQELLTATSVPKGSFYHHFESKEDFALQVIDRYMVGVHAGLDACLGDRTLAPLERVRRFFEARARPTAERGTSAVCSADLARSCRASTRSFRRRIEQCFQEIAVRIAGCLQEAIDLGELSRDTDARQLANLLVDCWEGAALRTRLLRDPAPLQAMLDFYFQSMAPSQKQLRQTPGRLKQAPPPLDASKQQRVAVAPSSKGMKPGDEAIATASKRSTSLRMTRRTKRVYRNARSALGSRCVRWSPLPPT